MRPAITTASSAAVLLAVACAASAQSMSTPVADSHRPSGRVSVTVDTSQRRDTDVTHRTSEVSTAVSLATPDFEGAGVEYGLNLRHSSRTGADVQHVSIYDGFAGVRLGSRGQVRLRAGHMWLPDLGTVGAIAGGLVELQQPRSDSSLRVRGGVFAGNEPLVYELGYAPDVRKMGGYVAFEKGFLQRHVVGYTRVRQAELTERSVLSVTNFVPAGQRLFVYQAAEFDVSGPANGTASSGLSYFLTNLRVTASSRVELFGTYNRGRAIDARTLTDDVRNGRAITPARIEGFLYESAGGRATVEVVRNVRVHAGYSRDRYDRNEAPSGRITIGGHGGNILGSGLDVSASNTHIDRPGGSYQSRYLSVGRSIGRSVYASADYATSLSIVRFVRSDGIVIETNPRMWRLSGNGSVTLGRYFSLMVTCDYERADASRQIRVLSGLGVRF
jgi:hypothetical protein